MPNRNPTFAEFQPAVMAPHRRASVVDNVNSEQWLVDIMDRFPDLASAMHTLQSLRKVSLMERRRHSIAFSALGGSGSGWPILNFFVLWGGGSCGQVTRQHGRLPVALATVMPAVPF